MMKQHDSPSDLPRPFADLSVHLPPRSSTDQPIPAFARTDELTTHVVLGTIPRSTFRQEYIKHKVQIGCFAGEDPVIHVEHPPHILEPLEGSTAPVSVALSIAGDRETNDGLNMDGHGVRKAGDAVRGLKTDEKSIDKVLGRKKKRLQVVLELPLRRLKVV